MLIAFIGKWRNISYRVRIIYVKKKLHESSINIFSMFSFFFRSSHKLKMWKPLNKLFPRLYLFLIGHILVPSSKLIIIYAKERHNDSAPI